MTNQLIGFALVDILECVCDKYCHYPKTSNTDAEMEEQCEKCEVMKQIDDLREKIGVC